MTKNTFPENEFLEICQNLERYHEIFSTLWRISKPRFDDSIPTAAVAFNPQGACIDFIINEEFWKSLDDYTKEFIICHEMCHVALSHGIRSSFYPKFSPEILNIALDLAVNHLLTSSFGFDRFFIKDWEKLCWVDTVLEIKPLDLDPNKSFEYYISKIEKICRENPSIKFKVVAQNHDYLSQFDQEATSKINRTANETTKKLKEDELDELDKIVSTHGRSDCEATNFKNYTGQNLKVKLIKKWESVMNKYVAKTEKEKELTQWARINRRVSMIGGNLCLPSDMEIHDKDFGKYKIWLFLDYSGSCRSLSNFFFSASKTFDRKKFEIKKFAHTTRVSEFDKNGKCDIWGGGTSFSCIETFIQNKISNKEISKYPDAILHFTDGHGNCPQTKYPERWYVFLSRGGSPHCFDTKTNIYKLEDFVK